MSITIGLKLDVSDADIDGKVALVALGPLGSKAALLERAMRQEAYAAQQLEELRYHKARLDEHGVGDRDAAASLLSLLSLAEQATMDAADLRAAIAASVELGPFCKEMLQ